MEQFIITVARETGSGGHNITRKLSAALGVPYYDRDLLRKASEVSGIHERLFGAADERIGLREMLSAAEKVYRGEILPPDSDDYISTRNLFSFQAKVIRELAETESCIILGRCANYLLADRPHAAAAVHPRSAGGAHEPGWPPIPWPGASGRWQSISGWRTSAGPPTTVTTPARSGGISRAMISPWTPKFWERTAVWSLSNRSCPPF